MRHDIALVISDLGSGGAQRVLTTLANIWVKENITVCVVTLSSPDSDFFHLDAGITRICIGGRGSSSNVIAAVAANIRRLSALRGALRQADARKVVAFVGAINILTILAAAGLGLEVVISERNDPERQSLGRVWDLLRRFVYPRASLVTANSRAAVAALKKFVPEQRVVYLPNPLLTPNPPRRPGGEPIILAVGRLSFQKAHDVLLRAFAIVVGSSHEWRLVIVGAGELKAELTRQMQTLGLEDRVTLAGKTHDPFSYYAAAQVFVLPSRYEGTPNALLEAMSVGLPVVVADSSPGPLEYVQDGVTGLVVPVEDENRLAEALLSLVADRALRERLGAAARAHIAELQLSEAPNTWRRVLGLPMPR